MAIIIAQLMIPIILYFQLLAQNLYPIVMAILGQNKPISTDVDFNEFSYSYTCIIVMVLLMGLTLIRKMGLFVKFSTYGVIFVFIILLFIIGMGIYGFTNTHYVFHQTILKEESEIKLFSDHYPPLLGILGGGYFLHVITLPIIKNAKKPEDNAKNVFIGYFLTFLSYTICGILGYFGFSGTYFTSMPNYHGILSNCLLMFPPGDILATIIRFCTFC